MLRPLIYSWLLLTAFSRCLLASALAKTELSLQRLTLKPRERGCVGSVSHSYLCWALVSCCPASEATGPLVGCLPLCQVHTLLQYARGGSHGWLSSRRGCGHGNSEHNTSSSAVDGEGAHQMRLWRWICSEKYNALCWHKILIIDKINKAIMSLFVEVLLPRTCWLRAVVSGSHGL